MHEGRNKIVFWRIWFCFRGLSRFDERLYTPLHPRSLTMRYVWLSIGRMVGWLVGYNEDFYTLS